MDQLESPVRELKRRRNKEGERQLDRDVSRTHALLGTDAYRKAFDGNLFALMAAAVLMPERQIGLLVIPLHTVTPPDQDPRILVGGVLVTLKDPRSSRGNERQKPDSPQADWARRSCTLRQYHTTLSYELKWRRTRGRLL